MSDYRLGVLGGMGPQATNTFYQYIIDRTAARTDQEHISMLIFSDNEVPDRTAAILSEDPQPVYDRLLYGARLLEQGGCTAIAVPCNTAYRMVLHGRFPYLSYPRRYRPEDHAAARKALEQADAWELAQLPVQTLSGGQRQKVYLAMALAQDTQTILMDEPTTYLDIQHQLDLLAFSQAMAREGRAVVLVLHDLCLALRFAHRGAVLSEGRLLQTGTPEELFSSGILTETFRTPLNRIRTEGGWRYYYD